MPDAPAPLDRPLLALLGALILIGLPLAPLAPLTPLALLSIALQGLPGGGAPEDKWILMILLPFSFAIGLLGLAQLAAAWGLKRGRRWGYQGALAISLVWCMAGLLPFGLLGLYALLRLEVRPRLGLARG